MVHHSDWTKKKLQSTCQSQSCARKWVIVTIWWSAVSLKYYSFVGPGETITSKKYAQQIDEIQAKTAILAASIGQKNGPNSSPQQCPAACHTTNASNVVWIGLQSFASYPIFRLPLTNWLDNFLQGKCFYNQQDVENPFQEFVESWSTGFYSTEISKLISHWQKYIDCNGSYFD